ncbi:hypothetical protein ACFYT7_10080 [Streptomyces sp. NPDC004041]|uniref:hypothetical protein n=1 Tax=Streptomyces sp. NPDC004041 TaxID=3364688 RepID=UPI00369233AD
MTTRENTETAPGLRRVTRPALVIGPLLALVSAWLLLVATPAAHDEERAFAAAEACPASAGATAVDCLRTVKAVIDRTEKETGKTALYWLYLTESDGTSTRTGLNGTPQQSPVARPGARVEVTYWRGEIRSVDFGSARRPTNADPRGDYRAPLSAGLGLGFYGAMFLAGAAATVRSARHSPRVYTWRTRLAVIGGLLLTGLGAVAPWPTDEISGALRLTAVGSLVILAGCALAVPFLRRRARHDDDTITLKPSVLTGEVCVLGVILGDVPYASTGGYLIAAPGLLATTPDPTGVFHRKAAAGTLTLLRVRPPYLTDPADRPTYDGRAVVLECADDGERVLIVTRGKDAPAVLSALGEAPEK